MKRADWPTSKRLAKRWLVAPAFMDTLTEDPRSNVTFDFIKPSHPDKSF